MVPSHAQAPTKSYETPQRSATWSVTVALDALQFQDSAVHPIFIPTPPKKVLRPQAIVPVVVSPISGKSVATKEEGVGNGQCVAFVQAHGFSKYRGNAGTWKRYINTKKPKAGDAVVLREGSVGHVAILESVASQSYTLIEQNMEGPYIISRRTIPKNYGRIVGFITQVLGSSQDSLAP